jgi:hypothetical protein
MGVLQVQETPEMYSQVTLPHIQSIPESHIQWVYNILARKVRYESSGAAVGVPILNLSTTS